MKTKIIIKKSFEFIINILVLLFVIFSFKFSIQILKKQIISTKIVHNKKLRENNNKTSKKRKIEIEINKIKIK